jgi:hypothetical protein
MIGSVARTDRMPICALVAIAFALGGCGGGSGGSTSSESEFKSAFSAAKPQLRSITIALDAAIARVASNPGAESAGQISALASRAAQEAGNLEGLNPPARFNTELRSLGSALQLTANDLSKISARATHNSLGAAVKSLRADVASIGSTETRVSESLGLPPG